MQLDPAARAHMRKGVAQDRPGVLEAGDGGAHVDVVEQRLPIVRQRRQRQHQVVPRVLRVCAHEANVGGRLPLVGLDQTQVCADDLAVWVQPRELVGPEACSGGDVEGVFRIL